jgi:hypothetical protein
MIDDLLNQLDSSIKVAKKNVKDLNNSINVI